MIAWIHHSGYFRGNFNLAIIKEEESFLDMITHCVNNRIAFTVNFTN